MLVTPLDNRVLVRLPRTAEKSSGGIILPESTRKKTDMDEQVMQIVKVGETAFLDLYIKPEEGNEVYVSRYAGTEWRHIKDDRYEYRLINDRDVTAIKADIDIQATIKELKNA